ncbi:DUF2235 domain-containing protein [Nocardia inohanensis]|uniref:DUF2235 domain-containing protein n=1 Tax=Nocardia inohanensis TaxID=209246 RepID=UPI000A06E862|nr:DUF2235 domain-containing protein [Nocardia inohanensis]
MKKRLVVCCDGTWKAESSDTVSNIVKIAQAVCLDGTGAAGEPVGQRVFYVSGPGAHGFATDKILGGAFGYGLEANLSSAYWQLALNWQPGDDIYIFGFSRGAYTARSLAGMIDRLGILKPEAMIEKKIYCEALEIYRTPKPKPGDPEPDRAVRFRAEHCYPDSQRIHFLGVFDTVGAMGIPGISRKKHQFHDVHLASSVHCARQALSIDDRRRAFEPCLWTVPVELHKKYRRTDRVKQVWFEGRHSDVGGGLDSCVLSDLSLRWMVGEAHAEGLEFDPVRLRELLPPARTPALRLELKTWPGVPYTILNCVRLLRHPRSKRFYWDAWRRLLEEGDQNSYLASTVEVERHANLRRWRDTLADKQIPAGLIEQIPSGPLPERPPRTRPIFLPGPVTPLPDPVVTVLDTTEPDDETAA